jgi:hypothetical protein
MRKALLLVLALSLMALLPAACGPGGGEAARGSAIDTSKLKTLSKKETAALEDKLLTQLVATNPDSLGNSRITGRLINLSDQSFAAVEISAVSGSSEDRTEVVGKTVVGPVAKQSEESFAVGTAIPITQVGPEELTFKIDKLMVDR